MQKKSAIVFALCVARALSRAFLPSAVACGRRSVAGNFAARNNFDQAPPNAAETGGRAACGFVCSRPGA